jgi:hypothetical protein
VVRTDERLRDQLGQAVPGTVEDVFNKGGAGKRPSVDQAADYSDRHEAATPIHNSQAPGPHSPGVMSALAAGRPTLHSTDPEVESRPGVRIAFSISLDQRRHRYKRGSAEPIISACRDAARAVTDNQPAVNFAASSVYHPSTSRIAAASTRSLIKPMELPAT